MGTSRSDPSPSIPTWQPARRVLGQCQVPLERQHLEIWRATLAERGEDLKNELTAPAMLNARCLADEPLSPFEAARRFDAFLAENHAFGLSLEMGKRALIRTRSMDDTAQSFVQEVFSEVVSYLVSRDLPSFVGLPGRIATVSEVVAIKSSFRALTRDKVAQYGPPPAQPRQWEAYIGRVVRGLAGATS